MGVFGTTGYSPFGNLGCQPQNIPPRKKGHVVCRGKKEHCSTNKNKDLDLNNK
jgi:hypothetical protein